MNSASLNSMVCDISQDTPQASDVFYVDTSALIEAFYTLGMAPAGSSASMTASVYGTYLQKVRRAGAKQILLNTQLGELSSAIEKIRFDVYTSMNSSQSNLKLKDYRRISTERQLVLGDIETTWNTVKKASKGGVTALPEILEEKLLLTLKETTLDGYDAIALEAMKVLGIDRVITHDFDFTSATGFIVHTVNRNALRFASKSCHR